MFAHCSVMLQKKRKPTARPTANFQAKHAHSVGKQEARVMWSKSNFLFRCENSSLIERLNRNFEKLISDRHRSTNSLHTTFLQMRTDAYILEILIDDNDDDDDTRTPYSFAPMCMCMSVWSISRPWISFRPFINGVRQPNQAQLHFSYTRLKLTSRCEWRATGSLFFPFVYTSSYERREWLREKNNEHTHSLHIIESISFYSLSRLVLPIRSEQSLVRRNYKDNNNNNNNNGDDEKYHSRSCYLKFFDLASSHWMRCISG